MVLSLIAAAAENNVIGKKNALPWNLPEDTRYFKNKTWGMPVIMGRKTFASMNNKPLNGRINIVITRDKGWKADGAIAVTSLSDAIFVAKGTDSNEAFVIGGGEIYKEAIRQADCIYLTRVHTLVDGDAFFPEVDEKKWSRVSAREYAADDRHQFNFTFEVWKKK